MTSGFGDLESVGGNIYFWADLSAKFSQPPRSRGGCLQQDGVQDNAFREQLLDCSGCSKKGKFAKPNGRKVKVKLTWVVGYKGVSSAKLKRKPRDGTVRKHPHIFTIALQGRKDGRLGAMREFIDPGPFDSFLVATM